MADDKCPTTGYTCVNTLVARVTAIVDQIEGFMALVEQDVFPLDGKLIARHYGKICDLLEQAATEYMGEHGIPNVYQDLEAVQWVLAGMKP